MEVEFNEPSYLEFLLYLSLKCGTGITDNKLNIPAHCGDGFFYAENFSAGFSCMVSRLKMNEDFVITKNAHPNSQYFVLLFSESLNDAPEKQMQDQIDAFNVGQHLVRLTGSAMRTQSILPTGKESRIVSILFTKQFLLSYIGQNKTDEFLSAYYASFIKTPYMAPMTAEYRIWLTEIFQETWEHPFRHLFLENRLLLLIEKFITQFMAPSKSIRKLSFNDEEVTRLVRAESALLKDYGTPPPTIDLLARMCAMSATKFKNDFKALYGMPVYEYYQKNRMLHARSLLIQEDYNIKEVGMMCGYSNLGHFAAAFKKEFGLLPSEVAAAQNNV